MEKIRLIIQSLMPWCIFFALDSYGQLELKIAIIGALIFILVFNNKLLRNGFIFDWGSLIFFVFLFVVVILFHHSWFIINAPLIANYTIALMIWVSVVIKKPIIMQYAKLSATKEFWQTQLFYRINNILTVFWGAVFTTTAILGTVQLYVWGEMLWLTELLPTSLLLVGLWFTFWFPEWYKRNIIGEWGVISIRNLSDLHIAHASISNIAYRTIGKGPKLVMLPPSNVNMYTWDPELLRRLSKKFQIIILDYPDIGESKLKQGNFTVSNLAHAIGEFITNLSDEKISLLGYSMGGWIAQEVAIHYPQHISMLVLIATDVGSPRSTITDKEIREHLSNNKTATYKEGGKLMQVMFPENKIKSMLPKMKTIFAAATISDDISNSVVLLEQDLAEKWYHGPGSYQHLGEIDATTLIVTGAQDKVVNRQNSLLLVNGIRGAKFIEFSDAGHGVIYQHPAAIADAIIKL